MKAKALFAIAIFCHVLLQCNALDNRKSSETRLLIVDKEVIDYKEELKSSNPLSDDYYLRPLAEDPTHIPNDYGFNPADLVPKGLDLNLSSKEAIEEFVTHLENPFKDSNFSTGKIAAKLNIFRKLGVYPPLRGFNGINFYGLKFNPYYCDEVDMLNLLRPNNIFENYNILNNFRYPQTKDLVDQVSENSTTLLRRREYKDIVNKDKPYSLLTNVTLFFYEDFDFQVVRSMGAPMLCASQAYSHIPNGDMFAVKEVFLSYFNEYEALNLPKTCIDYDMFFPRSYNLGKEKECKEFFKIITSENYQKSKDTSPIQFLSKLGDVHQGKGVDIMTTEREEDILERFAGGDDCGVQNESIIMQKYVGNPLLVYNHNKFDFRIYVLISSTDPLIAYYHDGFLRVSLQTFYPNSTDRKNHLTNTHVSDSIIDAAETEEEKDHLRAIQLSTFDMFLDNLEEQGILKGEEEKQAFLIKLRLKFKKSLAHLLRMIHKHLYRASGLYRLTGFDFMLDTDFNLWFIEANYAPQIFQIEKKRNQFMEEMFRGLFEIQYAYLRSRMMRLRTFIAEASKEFAEKGEEWDKSALRQRYRQLNKDGLEPELTINNNNGWEKIVDMSIGNTEEEGYLGHLDSSCFHH